MAIKHHYVPIFCQNVYYTTSKRSYKRYYKGSLDGCGGHTARLSNRDKTIFVIGVFNPNSRLHEITHLTQYILEYVGVNDHETFAYLLDYLYTEIQ